MLAQAFSIRFGGVIKGSVVKKRKCESRRQLLIIIICITKSTMMTPPFALNLRFDTELEKTYSQGMVRKSSDLNANNNSANTSLGTLIYFLFFQQYFKEGGIIETCGVLLQFHRLQLHGNRNLSETISSSTDVTNIKYL